MALSFERMTGTAVKICGVTSVAEAELCVEAGVEQRIVRIDDALRLATPDVETQAAVVATFAPGLRSPPVDGCPPEPADIVVVRAGRGESTINVAGPA